MTNKNIVDYNMNVIHEWEEVGGVLGYGTDINGDVKIYIMDDGEFDNKYLEYVEGKTDIIPTCLDREKFAELLCESALRNAGFCEEEIGLMMDWDADKMSNIMED